MEKELGGNELFTPFSLRCFPIGGNHLRGRFTILLIEKSQNKDRTSKSHYIAKCTLWECFSPWSYPGLVLISCRDIRLTPNDMVYVWVPWGWVLEGTISHFISWLPSCRRYPIWLRNERHFSISFPIFLPQKLKQLIVGQRGRRIGESLNGDSQGWELILFLLTWSPNWIMLPTDGQENRYWAVMLSSLCFSKSSVSSMCQDEGKPTLTFSYLSLL